MLDRHLHILKSEVRVFGARFQCPNVCALSELDPNEHFFFFFFFFPGASLPEPVFTISVSASSSVWLTV